MPEASKHLKQSYHNEEILSLFSENKKEAYFSDWYVTIAFYTSLHFVEAIIFNKGKFNVNKTMWVQGHHSSDFKAAIGKTSEHVVRTTLIYFNPDIFDEISKPYGTLYEMSRVARYDCHDTPCNDYVDAEVCLSEIKRSYKKITK
jgi:hypothetical protein